MASNSTRIDDHQIATITLQELHDILANGDLSLEHPEYGRILPSKFVLEDNVEPDEQQAVDMVMGQLNNLRDQLSLLDSAFHDIYDGSFC